jgi:hypothetical protein
MRRSTRTVRVAGVAALLLVVPSAVTPQTVQYAYDAAGRLSVVADARGDLAVYDYDAVGNLLSIRRVAVSGAPETVVVALVSPGAARRGATVSIFGKGFATTPSANTVAFNGAHADVLSATATRLTVTVPAAAVNGPVGVTSPSGAATSPMPFRVLGALAITPPTAVVTPGATVRFTASGEGIEAVRWSVDGLVGGDPRHGTITSDGLYLAPTSLPPDGARIDATSLDDPAIQATARVTMLGSRALFVVARDTVSVGVAAPTAPTFAMAPALTLAVAPIVLGVAPPEGARGETVRVTVRGAGFAGATRLEFLTGTAADPALAVGHLAISPEGDQATADVTIAADAAPGARIVRIVTPSSTSGGAASGDNLFTVR